MFFISGGLLAVAGLVCLPCRRLAAWERRRADLKKADSQLNDVTPSNTPAEPV